MSALPEKVPEVVDFPDPRPKMVEARAGLSLRRPSIDTIIQQMDPAKLKPSGSTDGDIEELNINIEQEESELRSKQREVARLQAESMERIRIARELELLLAARESVLDNRELLLSSRLVESVPDQKITLLEKSLNDSRKALSQANHALADMEGTISGLRAEIENIKTISLEPEQESQPVPVDRYAGITDQSLADQVAFLQEREAFIEESENVLFDKAQHLQEWETRLEQQEHDGMNTANTG